jgi:hypothetical protein
MFRPLLALVVALATLGAPLAAEACEATCAARDAGAPMSHHSCHHEAAARPGAAIAAIHVCGHEAGLPTALERTHHVVVMPAVASAVTLPAPAARTFDIGTASFDSSPPTSLNLISQLRV